jgi:hypothetical protein
VEICSDHYLCYLCITPVFYLYGSHDCNYLLCVMHLLGVFLTCGRDCVLRCLFAFVLWLNGMGIF